MPAALPARPADVTSGGPPPVRLVTLDPIIDPRAHLKWARGIARGVRRDHGFQSGSQEEYELEATAYLVVCELAPRFDPERSFKRGALRAMRGAAHAYRLGSRPAPAGPRVLGTQIEVEGHDVTRWVYVRARRLAKDRIPESKGHAAEYAARAALAFARAFDCGGAFRGWAAVEVRSRCRREALRLRNGGTYHTTGTARGKAVRVEGLPVDQEGQVRPDLDARRPVLEEDEGDEWSPYVVTADE